MHQRSPRRYERPLCRKWPGAVAELQDQEAVVLAGRHQRLRTSAEAQLCRAVVGPAGRGARVVQRARARRGDRRWDEISDLARMARIANVEDADPRLEVRACERRRVARIVDAAVVAAVREAGEAD